MADAKISGRHGAVSYRYIEGKEPCVLFMHGTLSDKNASKALYLEQLCRDAGRAYCAFDFTGHGESDGKYTDGTIGVWTDNALQVIDSVIKGSVVIVGSSMGGWIMLLAALARPERVCGCLGLAAAPDFTVDVWNGFSEEQKQTVEQKGIVYTPNGWTVDGDPWTKELFVDGAKHLLLDKKLPLTCPMILIQGDKDDCVAADTPFRIKDAVDSERVEIVFLKNAGHRLSEPRELAIVGRALTGLIDEINTVK